MKFQEHFCDPVIKENLQHSCQFSFDTPILEAEKHNAKIFNLTHII